MSEVTEAKTPETMALLKSCTENAAFGDGSFLAILERILELMAPFLVGCMPSRAKFIEASRQPTRFQESRLVHIGTRCARHAGAPFRDRRSLGETAANTLATGVERASDRQLAAVYDELK